jgi:hypothetical protein
MHAQNVCFKKKDEDTSCLGQHSMHLSGPSSAAGTKRTRQQKQKCVTTVRIGSPAVLLQAPIQGHETSQVQEQQVQRLRVCIVHSLDYTTALYCGMCFIHNNHDILLSSLLVSCNLLGKNNNNDGSSILLDAVAPRLATKSDLSMRSGSFNHHYGSSCPSNTNIGQQQDNLIFGMVSAIKKILKKKKYLLYFPSLLEYPSEQDLCVGICY